MFYFACNHGLNVRVISESWNVNFIVEFLLILYCNSIEMITVVLYIKKT